MAKRISPRPTLALVGLVAALALLALVPTAQAATLEGAGCFAGGPAFGLAEACKPVAEEHFTEEVQLGGVGGMAVNYTGAGGVPKGTVYAVAGTRVLGAELAVVMFEPKEGGLKFEQAWGIPTEAGGFSERCGPLLGVDGEGKAEHPCLARAEALARLVDVDVNETTGEVFVDYGSGTAGNKTIVAYTPDGSEELTRFGELAPPGEKISESPAKIHGSPQPGQIAVGAGGEVYVYDKDSTSAQRLMGFKPDGSGGYEYAAGEDIGAATATQVTQPVADAAGRLYVASIGAVEEYDPAHPANPPICTFKPAKNGIRGLAVNQLTGEPYFYSFRVSTGFATKTVHQLGPCNEATHRFEGPKGEEEVGQFEVKPERDQLWALTFDPVDKLEATRPAGILYGGAPGPVPPVGLGTGEAGQSSLGYVFAPAKLQEQPPQVEAESVAKVSASSAELGAKVNPEGFEASWRFEYETQAQYVEDGESFAAALEAPTGGGTLPNRKEALAVSASLAGLSPDTTYRYRAVAESECSPAEPGRTCEVDGEALAFHTFPVTLPGLPDHRAYELVSPAQKHGGEVFPADPFISSCGLTECKPGTFAGRFSMQSAPEGDAVAYEGTAFDSAGASLENSYVARRDPSTGWQSANPTPALLRSKGGAGYMAFDEGLGEAVLSQEQLQPALSPQAPAEYENLYAQPTTSPFAVRPFLTEAPPGREADEFRLAYAGASADLSRVFFAANAALTGPTPVAPAAPEVEVGGQGGCAFSSCDLYEFHEGHLALVNVAPGNPPEALSAAFVGAGSANGVSKDGSRVFFADEEGHLYVRIDGQETLPIPGSGPAAGFLSASVSGFRVLLGDGHLYDLKTEEATDLTEDQGHVHKGGFVGLVGQSDDLSHLYFVDTEVLTGSEESCRAGASEEEICEVAQATKDNLYAWEEGTTRFVATLLAGDNTIYPGGDWKPLPSKRLAEASPQGRYLAFLSKAQLTGYDNVGLCELVGETGEFVPGTCPEVFLYDSQTGRLSCPSCNPSGERPFGHSFLPLLEGSEWLPQSRYLFDSGRLYFDSQDSLSLADTNEGVEDVYQYEPEGIGTCGSEAGCVSLISAGSESVDSNFLAADETGKNVFFTTRDRLTLRDRDELLDLYDAREFGGIAAETETQRAECSGEACQPAPAPPANPTPASAAFAGSGNLREGPAKARCPKGRRAVKRHGKTRCLAKDRKHHKHRRAHR